MSQDVSRAAPIATGQRPKLVMFDLDHTLLPLDSDYAWGQFSCSLGWNDSVEHARRNDAFYQQYKAGTLDIHEFIRFATSTIRHQGRAKAEAAHREFMRQVIEPAIHPEALALVREHQRETPLVLIVTATNEFVTGPIAQAFGVSDLLALDLERDTQGWFTGEILGVPTFRAGKVRRMEEWLAQRGLSWGTVESTFYSDSINDLPLLEKVNHPVATNPDERLRAIARTRGWPILDLFGAHPTMPPPATP